MASESGARHPDVTAVRDPSSGANHTSSNKKNSEYDIVVQAMGPCSGSPCLDWLYILYFVHGSKVLYPGPDLDGTHYWN